MEPVSALVFHVLVLGDDADERWTRATRALRSDPHLAVAESVSADAPVDLVVIVSATADEVRPILDRLRADVPVVVCDGHGDAFLIGLADIVVSLPEPTILVETVRWLLGLPSWVAPARRAALRRLMGR